MHAQMDFLKLYRLFVILIEGESWTWGQVFFIRGREWILLRRLSIILLCPRRATFSAQTHISH